MSQHVLDLWLKSVSIEGGMFARCLFGAASDMGVANADTALLFHIVTQGDCFLLWTEGRGEQSTALHPGDMVLLQGAVPHRLTDRPETPSGPAKALDKRYLSDFQTQHFGAGSFCLLCGYFDIDATHLQRLLGSFPPVVVLRQNHDTQQLQGIVALLEAEAQAWSAGSSTITSRLSQGMFLYVLRAWAAQYPQATGLMAASADPMVGQALNLMHQHPEEAWTVASLAEASHASRANFARRFTQLMGLSPIDYLTDVRMQKAAQILNATQLSVEAIAERVGYRSEAAFAKAFKKHMGTPPGQFRQQ